ncbi:murein hydrolase activator EnvC family protein [Hydrogenimonas cancrithermarum]|uniref:Peptidase M23 n=1 Tax=Hydrogenimonas cancrithermarum TaxID=2993563 RepID=A0ABM8FNB8_9BACT|nr:peptidoglycan DD-metalloendopeptidase family protein [Hydrogenimonas cancrithermarum]BDY13895.1 peptidase M23 [Hydrogenimonas cancrithermarum]
MGGKIFLFLVMLLPFLSAATIDKKIERSKARLASTKNAFANMDRKLAKIARQIAANQKNLRKLDETIAKLDKEIAVNAVLLEEGKKRLVTIESQLRKLKKERLEKERKLVDMLADRYVIEEIVRDKEMQSPENVIESELLAALIKSDSEALKSLQSSYLKTLKRSEALNREAQRIKAMIVRLQNRKKEAAREKERRSRLMAKLEKEKKAYQSRLEKLQKEESDLRKTLAKLNILKRESLSQRKKKKQTSVAIAKGDKLKVRTIGSSYQRHAIGRYRGKKTISPVGKAKVVKKFGPYVDPVYGIKIFNESVTLQPYKKRAKVKNVLNGRVVFVKDTPMLGKVVIIEHKNNLHTIYAKMDKIAPTIKEGKKIKKGYVIGRVEKELMFEVTQKNRHINPLELIRLK